jgi:outer membrane protein assembly factor BamD
MALIACSSSKKDPYKEMSAEQIYSQGKTSAKKERFAMAVKDFEALEARYPYGEYTCKAQLALIHAYYKQDEPTSALAAADRFIRMYPNHKNIDYVYYLKGLINYDENYSMAYRYFPIDRSLRDPTLARQAFSDFKVLLQRFPNSKYATDAQMRMIHLRNQLANYELYIAEHYLKKKAYIAAANRAGYIINQFEHSESIPHALAIMVKAYQALGMDILANDALATLNKNFPQYSFKNL